MEERSRDDPEWGDYVVDFSDTLKSFSGTYTNEIFGNVLIKFAEDEGLQLTYAR